MEKNIWSHGISNEVWNFIWHTVDEPKHCGCRIFMLFFNAIRGISNDAALCNCSLWASVTQYVGGESRSCITQKKSSTLQGENFLSTTFLPLFFQTHFFVTTQLRHQGSIFLSNQMDERWHPLVSQCGTGTWHYPKLSLPPKGPRPTTTAKPTVKAVCVICIESMMVKIHLRINQWFNIRHCVWIWGVFGVGCSK